MGVMACDRKGCDSIMCDKYSTEFGYICYSCLKELKGIQSNKELKFEDIHRFMDTPKFYNNIVDLDEIFN